jgi:hypothetical protein
MLMLPPHPLVTMLPDMPAELRNALEGLRRATGHFLVVAHRYEMYRAIARDPAFVARINRTTAAEGMNTIRGALTATLVISLAALFDQNSDSTSLTRVLNSIIVSARAGTFAALHASFIPAIDTGPALDGLHRLRSRLSRAPLRGALDRLWDLRNQNVAHLDVDPTFPKGRALTGDIDLVHAASANTIVKANRFCGVHVRVSDVRAEARSQALAFCRSIQPCPLPCA